MSGSSVLSHTATAGGETLLVAVAVALIDAGPTTVPRGDNAAPKVLAAALRSAAGLRGQPERVQLLGAVNDQVMQPHG